MKTSILKSGILLSVFLIALNYNNLNSQPAEFARERIETLKMVKLLEILDLNEDESDKFMVKYKSLEKQIKAKAETLDDIEDDLQKALKRDVSDKELKELSDKMIVAQKEFFDANIEKIKSMQSTLNQKNYAKLLIFEKNFHKKLRNMLIDKSKKRGMQMEDFDGDAPPPPKRKR